LAPTFSPPGGVVSPPEYALAASMNVANRWNGNEPGVSTDRAELLPRPLSPPGPLPPLKVQVVWFAQSLKRDWSHFDVTLQNIDRDNRGGTTGIGASGPRSYTEDPNPLMNHWFPMAHESGHMDGMPDEYNARWWGASYDQLSFKANLPGDPYEPDGRDETGDLAASPMMNGNKRMRNRYFWHAAEWVRRVTNVPMKVKLGNTYDDYWLPGHPRVDQGPTFYPWPVAHQLGAAGGAAHPVPSTPAHTT